MPETFVETSFQNTIFFRTLHKISYSESNLTTLISCSRTQRFLGLESFGLVVWYKKIHFFPLQGFVIFHIDGCLLYWNLKVELELVTRYLSFRYTIEVTNGKHQWKIQRRYNHFRHLHRHLEIFRASVVVQHPTMVTRFGSVPKFPHRPEFTILSEKSREKMKRRLQKFLQNVVKHDRLRNCTPTLDFLEVSHLSFIDQLGGKRK